MIGTTPTNPYPRAFAHINIIQKHIPSDHFDVLDSIPSNEKITNTLISLHNNKAPAPMNSILFSSKKHGIQ